MPIQQLDSDTVIAEGTATTQGGETVRVKLKPSKVFLDKLNDIIRALNALS